jgi:hypothetical protein
MFESSDLKEFNSYIKACLYKLQLNAEKCKELSIIDFMIKHSKHGFEPLTVNGNLLSVRSESLKLPPVERPYW